MLCLPILIGEVVFVSFRNDEAAVIMKALKELTEKIKTIYFKKEALYKSSLFEELIKLTFLRNVSVYIVPLQTFQANDVDFNRVSTKPKN